MSRALLELTATIRALLGQVLRDEVLTRHQIGSHVVAAKRAPSTYGTNAVENIAADVGVSSDELYRAAAVAETWTADELKKLAARTNRAGRPLSWSHWVALTKAPPAARHRLIERCLAESWSVRELRLNVVRPSSADAVSDDVSVHSALTEGLRTAKKAAADLTVFIEALETRLGDGSPDDPLVARVLDACEQVEEVARDARVRIERAARASETRLRVSAPHVSRQPASGEHAEDDGAQRQAGGRSFAVRSRSPGK